MTGIKRVWLKNFQSHKNTEVEFGPGVNAIVGHSDSGKSAIVRGLRWLFFNRPSGDGFRSHWGGATEVGVETMEGDKLVRVKDKGVNAYFLNDKELKAFGADVPQDILEAFPIPERNWQLQLDSPFLLSDTPSETARHLNEIAKLDDIDVALTNIGRMMRENAIGVKETTGALSGFRATLDRFDGLDEADDLLKSAESVLQALTARQNDYRGLSDTLTGFGYTLSRLSGVEAVLNFEPTLGGLERAFKGMKEKQELRTGLEAAVKELDWGDRVFARANVVLAQAGAVVELESVLETKNQLTKEVEALNGLLSSIDSTGVQAANVELQLKALEKRWHEVCPKECPLCKQPITL